MADIEFQESSGPRVEVTRRHATTDLSNIPAEVVDAFTAIGYRLTLASKFENAQADLSRYQRYPLTEEDLRKISRAKGPKDDGFDPTRSLKVRGAFRTTPEGYFSKGDCYVYIQPADAYEAQLGEALEMWLVQDDPNTHIAHFEDMSLFTPHGRVGPTRDHPIGHLRDSIGRSDPQ